VYADLPPEIKLAARKQHRLWKDNPPPSLAAIQKGRPILVRKNHRKLPLARVVAE